MGRDASSQETRVALVQKHQELSTQSEYDLFKTHCMIRF